MTQIVKVDFTGPKSVTPLTALDALSKEAQSVVDIRERIKKFLEAEPHTLEDADKRIAELQALRPSEQRLAGLTTQTDHGLSRATSEQIQEQLALLLGAFPSSNTPDPMVYSRMMLNEVLAAEPSVIALTMACSELRRTLQWPPSIADVLKAIREQEMRWQYRLRCASAIVDDHAEALSKLLERRAWLARPDAEKEAERKEHLARMESLRQLFRGVVAKRPERKMSKTLPKTARGRRIMSFTQCRRNCRCGRDPEHGPYFLKRWREGGRREEACVPWQEVAATFDALGPLGREQREEPKSDDALPKRAVGSLHLEFKRCGQPNCRCSRGLRHGPYVYKHWRENGRQKKEYVPMKQLGEITLELERQRAERVRPAEVRRILKEVRHA